MRKYVLTIILSILSTCAFGQVLHDESNVNPGSTAKMPDVPYTDIYSLLQTIPGVEVIGGAVSIRGSDPFAGEEPLILYDGVEIFDLDEVNPNDVYSVDVIKGPEAAIYGERGMYGVISIRSKGEQYIREADKQARLAEEAEDAAINARGLAKTKAKAAEAAREIAEKAREFANAISEKAEKLKITVFGSPEEKAAQREARKAEKAAQAARIKAERAAAEAESAEKDAQAAEENAAKAAEAADRDASATNAASESNGQKKKNNVSITYSTGTQIR